MALIYADGFDKYSTAGGVTRGPWHRADDGSGNNWTVQTTGGVNGGGAIDLDEEFFSSLDTSGLVLNMPPTSSTVYVGMWIKFELPYDYAFLKIMPQIQGSKMLVGLFASRTGGFMLYTESNIYFKESTRGGIWEYGKWGYLEIEIVPGVTNDGRLRIYYNDEEVHDTGATFDMGNNDTEVDATVMQLQFSGGPTNDYTVSIDDLLVYDSSGTDNFTSRLGPQYIDTIRPDGNGTTNNGTASAGSQYQCVDETGDWNTTDYVTVTTAGNKELYTFAALSETMQNIKGVQVTAIERSVSGPRQSRCLAYHSATTGNGTTRDIEYGAGDDTAYWNQQHMFSKNPSTTADWTATEVNAAEFGVELVS